MFYLFLLSFFLFFRFADAILHLAVFLNIIILTYQQKKKKKKKKTGNFRSVWYMCLKTENCYLKTFVEIRVGEKMCGNA